MRSCSMTWAGTGKQAHSAEVMQMLQLVLPSLCPQRFDGLHVAEFLALLP